MRVAIYVANVSLLILSVAMGIHLLGSLPVPDPDIRLERLGTEIFTIRLLLVCIIEHCYHIIVFMF